jgi:hypothetical protein
MTTQDQPDVGAAVEPAASDPQDSPADVLGTPTTAVSGDQEAALRAVEETAGALRTDPHDS